MHKLEHDLLACKQRSGPPGGKRLLSRLDGCPQLGVGGLRNAGDEVVCGGVVQVDPLGGGGGGEFVVDEVLRVLWRGDLLVVHGVVDGCHCCGCLSWGRCGVY